MIADIRSLSGHVALDTDVCIIGGGAAGIAIAREFIPCSVNVILLESGGYRAEREVQNLYAGDSIGEDYYQELDACRSRYLGGSTNCWGAICTPLNEIDFARRPWVRWSGWPVLYGEIFPWMRQAHEGYGAGPFLYDAAAWPAASIAPANFDPAYFQRFVWHFNSRADTLSFGKRFRGELRKAANIRVLLHANVTELQTNEAGTAVESVAVKTLDGGTRQVRAKLFVLACGGIENARLMLASNKGNPKGVGNDRDVVGRFFHEHLQMPCGFLVPGGNRLGAARYSHLSKLGGTFCLPGLTLSPAAQEKYQTLNASLSVDPYHERESALLAFQKIRADLKARKISRSMLNHIWRMCCDSNKLAPEAWRRVVHGDRPQGDPDRFLVFARAEQAPNPDSRVTLSRDTDRLGMRRACLDWRTTPLDRSAVRLISKFAAAEFKRLGLGTIVETPMPEGDRWPSSMVGGPHHMGTTRMSDDPSTGVVDKNCKVHGLGGLYVAGSSVFPTGGHANPTLSILAFSLRLAGHLRDVLARGPQEIAHFTTGVTAHAKSKKTSAA